MLLCVEAKAKNSLIYLSWHNILEAKKNCYPNCVTIKITKKEAEIRIQDSNLKKYMLPRNKDYMGI